MANIVARSVSASTHFLWLVCRCRNFCRHLCGFRLRLFVQRVPPSLQHDFAASRGSISLVFSLAGFLYFGLGVITGPLADRWGSRLLAVIGMILTGVGLGVASVARSLIEVYAAYGLGVGLGIGCSYVPAVGAVQRWFVRRRGFASGLAVSGIGVGTLVVPPLAALLIDTLGWRETYLVLGIFAHRRRRRAGLPDRGRSAAPRPWRRRRSAERAARRPRRPESRSAKRSRRGASSAFMRPASSARSGCSCRSCISCRTRWTTASHSRRPCFCRRDRCRQHRGTFSARRPCRSAGPAAVVSDHVCRHGAFVRHLAVLRRAFGRSRLSRWFLACSTAALSRSRRRWLSIISAGATPRA